MSESKAIAIIPQSVPEVQSLAELIGKSTLLPDALRGKTADIVVSILAGAELGLPPMSAIRGVFVVQGKPVLAADTMVGLVLGSGLAEYFVQLESSATSVTFETKRKGAPVPQRCTWTMDDAKRAGLATKDTWRLYPRQMLASRAKAELARSAYSDVLAGVYDPDELPAAPSVATATVPAYERADNSDAEDAEVVESTPTVDLSAIDAAPDLDALTALAPALGTLKGEARKLAKARYDARKTELSNGHAPAEAQ